MVIDHLKRAGVKTRRNLRKMTDAQAAEAAEMYRSGADVKTVARHFGVNPNTARKELLGAGVDLRALAAKKSKPESQA